MTQVYARPDPFAAEEPALEALRRQEGVDGNLGTGAPETLEEMGHALLELIRAAAVDKGVVLPDRQSVYMAPIPADCAQVAVLFTSWNPTPVGDGGVVICQPWRWLAPMSAIITRCTPAVPGKNKSLGTVTVDQLNAAAAVASADAEVLLAVVNRLHEIGSDTSVVTNAPSGGYQTVELNVSLVSGGSFL
jgi:hypothetical protein